MTVLIINGESYPREHEAERQGEFEGGKLSQKVKREFSLSHARLTRSEAEKGSSFVHVITPSLSRVLTRRLKVTLFKHFLRSH